MYRHRDVARFMIEGLNLLLSGELPPKAPISVNLMDDPDVGWGSRPLNPFHQFIGRQLTPRRV